MSKKSEKKETYNDLCVSCKHFSSCVYVKNGNRPVYYCEEFEVSSYKAGKKSSPAEKSKKKEEKLIFHGLCKNCGNRMTCSLASPDRIIWHCEEYV